ncbi:MAG: sporulation protein YunB [Clostridia bacterium]|nr:sporulation protein YunB [Clostridia bacterium]
MKKWIRKTVIFVITLFLAMVVVLWGISRLEPVVLSFAEEQFRNRTAKSVALSVAEVMAEENIEYSSLIDIDTDTDGNVTRLSANTPKINLLKSEVSLRILEKLNRDVKSEKVPLGNLTGILFLTAKGPSFNVRLTDIESLSVETVSTFSSQGINQTRHTITLTLKLRLNIALFTKPRKLEIEDSVVIADIVIVGRVPDGYTAVNKADGELIGDIVDFRAE